MQDNYYTHLIIIILLTFVSLNLLILDLKVFTPGSAIKLSDVTTVATPQPTILPSVTPRALIVSPTISQITFIQPANRSTTPREYYIPLGSGSTSNTKWEDLIATETLIDPAKYPGLIETYFIASLRNPTQNGQVETQLYNVTDKHPVWGSHVILNGPQSQTITSGKITLDTGSKLYRVQIKSSLSYLVYLDNAKIRIVTE